MIADDSPQAIDACRSLSEEMVTTTGHENDTHWNDSAKLRFSAMAAVVVRFGEAGDRSLQTVRTLITQPAKMEAAIKLMCASDAWGGMLSRIGHQLTNVNDKELASILSTTNRHLAFLDTLVVAPNTSRSTFDPADLCKGKMTIYLVIPPHQMRPQTALLRMWIGSMLRAVVANAGLQEANKVHFILDEAASLGHLPILDDAVDKYRGYGVRMLFFYQSLGQLKSCWPDGRDQTLLANTTNVFFSTLDHATAEQISNRLGEKTIVVDSGGTSGGRSDSTNKNDPGGNFGTSSNQNSNWAQQARKLLKPEEVAQLSPRTAITFTPGLPPVATTLTRYYEETNQGKGRWARIRWLEEVWIAALFFLALSLAMAAAVTAMQVPQTR